MKKATFGKVTLLACLIVAIIIPIHAGVLTEKDRVIQQPDFSTQTVNVGAVYAPIDALAFAMLENEQTYQINDSTFFWTGLYYMLSFYGQMDSRAEQTDEKLILLSEIVHDYANSLYFGFEALPALPDELSAFITYDLDSDCFILQRGDIAQSELFIDYFQVDAQGDAVARGFIKSPVNGKVMCTFEATLFADDSMFEFTIGNMVLTPCK